MIRTLTIAALAVVTLVGCGSSGDITQEAHNTALEKAKGLRFHELAWTQGDIAISRIHHDNDPDGSNAACNSRACRSPDWRTRLSSSARAILPRTLRAMALNEWPQPKVGRFSNGTRTSSSAHLAAGLVWKSHIMAHGWNTAHSLSLLNGSRQTTNRIKAHSVSHGA